MKIEAIRYAAIGRHYSGAIIYDDGEDASAAIVDGVELARRGPCRLGTWQPAGGPRLYRVCRGHVWQGIRAAGPEQAAALANALWADPD